MLSNKSNIQVIILCMGGQFIYNEYIDMKGHSWLYFLEFHIGGLSYNLVAFTFQFN